MQNAATFYAYARVSTDARTSPTRWPSATPRYVRRSSARRLIGPTAERPELKRLMSKPTAGEIVVIQVVDRLSLDTTDLLVIARDMHCAGAGLRSLAEQARG